MRLSMVKPQTTVQIESFELERHLKLKLLSLGLMRGSRFLVSQAEYGGPMRIQYKESHLAIGWDLQQGIEVSTYRETTL